MSAPAANPPRKSKRLLIATPVFLALCALLYARPFLDRATQPPQSAFRFPSAAFVLKDAYVGEDFYDRWTWETLNDPTNGRVNYVGLRDAQRANLTQATADKFIMSADSHSVVPSRARGRDSIRIVSKAAYADSLIVLDLAHMPEGCATWPAFWTLSAAGPWPHGGEIDILEGVHLQTRNLASQHTSPHCSMTPVRQHSGTSTANDCDASVNYNQGCGVEFSNPKSYGAAFNNANGGFFAMQRTREQGVQVWFWSRDDPLVPLEIRAGVPVITPTPLWGLPEATFPTESCDYDSHFDAHQMVFDLTFCGDWAGAVWATAGCGAESCIDYVNNHPQAFSKAYWEVNSIHVYTPL